MPEPIEYQIIKNLQEAFRGISKTAAPDPYFHDVESVSVKLDPNQDAEEFIASLVTDDPQEPKKPFLYIELDADGPWDYSERPLRVVLTVPLTIHFVNNSDPEDDDSMMRTYFRLCADIEQAMAVDISRGELATDTLIVSRQMSAELRGQQVWAMVSANIRVYRGYGQPNG